MSKNMYQQIFRGIYYDTWNNSYRKVWIKSAIEDSNIIAMKVIREVMNEIQVMKKIERHENISTFYGWCEYQSTLYIIIQEPKYGDLRSYLLKRRLNPITQSVPKMQKENVNKDFNNAIINNENNDNEYTTFNTALMIRIAHDIASGMEYVNELKIIHRNLCCRSIHLGEDQYNLTIVAKISDFSLACHSDITLTSDTSLDIPTRWMALESLKYKEFSQKSDVWSFGILLWEIASYGTIPYSEIINDDQMIMLLNKGYRLSQPENCNQEFYDTMEWCWNYDPRVRPTFNELKKSLKYLLRNQLQLRFTTQNDDFVKENKFSIKPLLTFKQVKGKLPSNLQERQSYPNYVQKMHTDKFIEDDISESSEESFC
ncbi:unnamed protein product [Gordionus sp. m RMFG-2023]